ncbi:CAMP factor family pore-forming toxin [uncultured Anaerococcus sp.]|uniref:CAMP factor family pore-forming toxin n=1 Tax=uncultured Anaerococcus sp. TaxID=293428 RepID=UPI0028048AC0|nr:CAMP factor family pore-forming toxin [uncultured Anaerococcus sp.]MDU2585118.1 CAMP factor family pore-forming toxin [Anaerococcus prevotii]
MKKSQLLAATLSVALLSNTVVPCLGSIAKDDSKLSSVAYAAEEGSAKDQAIDKLDYLGDLIKGLENIAGGLAGNQLDWLKSLKNAYDFVSKIVKNGLIGAGEIREKVIPRINLLINVAETITADATELVDSEQQAHVIIGFSVTRALLKATDIFENADGLNKASKDLLNSLEKARKVPKLTEDSKRTHYTLEKLDRAIANAREVRNRELRFKLDSVALADVDSAIKSAVEVRRNNQATVGQVQEATDNLNAKISEAVASIPDEDKTASAKDKAELGKYIEEAKKVRDFELKGKVDSSVIRELNRAIADANRIFRNNRTTVNEANVAYEELLKAIEKAKANLVVEEPAEEVEEVPAEEKTDEEISEDEVDEELPEEETKEGSDEEASEKEVPAEETVEAEDKAEDEKEDKIEEGEANEEDLEEIAE